MTTPTLAAPWRDKKRAYWLLGAVIVALPLYALAGYSLTGSGLFWWLGPIFVYGVIPLLDRLRGTDADNPPEERVPSLAQERYYRWAIYLAIPIQYLSFVVGTWIAVTQPLAWWELLGLVLTVGGVSGAAINIGHELGHATDPVDRWLAKIALAPVIYGHFYVEHNRGHHVRVATPDDPASARFGETFWEFLPRCVIGSIASAWAIEKRRLARQGHSAWHWSNDNLQSWALSALIFGAMTVWLGWIALPFMLLQAAYGGSLLEVVNYLEHYGLRRQQRPDGSYERCQPHHSWNSNHVVTNLFLYHLQRHSDHHANPTRPYQALRHFDEAPQLPSGYASMILLAYFPPLWFKVMDPKVVAHHGGDMSRANIKPAIRERVLAQYRAPTDAPANRA
jgi:alkane 1-monooxygenase